MKWASVILSVVFVTSTLFTCVPALRNVTIMKCCGVNETLTWDHKCLDGSNKKWSLLVRGKSNGTPDLRRYDRLQKNWWLRESAKPECKNPITVDLKSNSHIFLLNGSLYSLEFSHSLVHPSNYCLDYEYAIFCADNLYKDPARLTASLVRKCCGENAVFSETNSSCIRMKDKSYRIDLPSDITLGSGFPTCSGRFVVAGKLNEGHKMLGNGSLLEAAGGLVVSANYCLEHILEHSGREPSIIKCHQYPQVIAKPVTHDNDFRFTLYPIALAISVIFLVATLAAGSLLPASHHVLHWRCQTNHVACLMVGNVLLCITQLSRNMEYAPCVSIAVAMHFLFLAAFFWLNTMCFNIWWTFKDLRPQNTEKSQERLRLRLYEAYAWGVPLIIALIAAIFDLVPENPEYEFLRPKFGKNSCWFHGDMEILTFFYGPVGTLLFINVLLFALTARELTCGVWKIEVVKSTTEKAALGRICIKLVVAMGVTWVLEIISWAAGGPKELWYLTDLINCLQGVFIFIIVGCQPQVRTAVKRAWCLRKHRQNGTAGTTNHHSSSSQGLPSLGDTVTNTNSVTQNTKTVPLETNC